MKGNSKRTFTVRPSGRGALLALFSAGFAPLVAACIDDDLADAPMSPAASDALTDDELGESPLQLALAREIPGFGGIWYEPGEGGGPEGRLVLALTEAGVGGLPRARRAVLTAMSQFAPPTADAPEMLDRVVEHAFLEMAKHRARLRPRLFGMDEVVSLSVDEELNRIRVGVTDLAFASAVQEAAADLGVPEAMLEIVRGSPVEHLAATVDDSPGSRSPAPADWPLKLTDRIPDRRLAGGYEAANRLKVDTVCTIGFTTVSRVWTWEDGRTKGFVSASHCTRLPFEPDPSDDSDWKQPYDGSRGSRKSKVGLVGEELWDPEARSCEHGRCRHADAALMEVDEDSAGIAFGKIARTRKAQRHCEVGVPFGGCVRTIDKDNPTFTIVFERPHPLPGRSIHKVGRTTGWTYGKVRETCVDGREKHGYWIYCSHKLKLHASGNDSGAPVFMIDEFSRDSSDVNLVGIVWGRNREDTTIYISGMDQIRKDFRDLGDFLTYFHRDSLPPSINDIDGPRNPPKEDPPAFFECKWFADVKSEGMHPPTYEWSGVLSGTGDTLWAKTPDTAGWLFVKLTDAAGQTAEDSAFIVPVDDNDDEEDCIKVNDTRLD